MKKKMVLGIGLLSLLVFGACGKDGSAEEDEVKTVGALQFVQHESLDDSYSGFVKGLEEEGFVDGENLKIDYQNAQGSQDNLKSISEKLVKEKPDLLLGVTTVAGQSLLTATQDIPIVVTCVTDLKDAKLVDSYEKPGGNVTGTTNMSPVAKQIKLLLSIVPNAKKVGIMYNSGEINSKIQADIAEKELKKAGIEPVIRTVTSTNDVQQVSQTVAEEVDGIYLPTDNTFASAKTIVGDVMKEKKVPLVAGAINDVKEAGVATIGINYEELGVQTGKMAAKILRGEATPAEMPVEDSKNLEFYVNEDMCEALGIDPSSIKNPEE
ncbi:ABC transporter ATP-binding protein [Enterococcus florum]|uniref:ABC transporter ATP-binding protein n=1 Tax=Enterococcus florum TaxID=2480627 RepID=A0A4P5PB63_9ENTE|nr:ABC transporter substrate-binding protein [Enterococcus florum]GCF94936.1 ABC transporter ATP-binding protein [Enterococcus florum]